VVTATSWQRPDRSDGQLGSRTLEGMPTPSDVRALLRPSMLLLHLAGVLAVTAAGWLGWWQVGAWQAHREDRAAALAHADPVPLDDALGPDDAFVGENVGRPGEVQGRWLPEVLHVGDRLRDSDPDSPQGVWQVGLLQVCGRPAACNDAPSIPVVLGWAPTTTGGPTPRGRVDLVGWLQPSESGEDSSGPATGDVLPALRTADLLGRVPGDVYSGYVILRSPAAERGDLVPVTPDSLPGPPASTALRNLFYGIEWWVFAAFAAYLWWHWTLDAVRAERGRGTASRAREDHRIASEA
jgi:cytochrome oxidase assembly protein ShyY1